MKKKSELIKELDELKAEKLQREREENRPFRIFIGLENGIMITEGVGKKIRVMESYVFKGYNLYGQAIFDQVAQYTPKD